MLCPFKGDIKIHSLQPPFSAASCSQLIKKRLYVALECCNILAAAGGYFDVSPIGPATRCDKMGRRPIGVVTTVVASSKGILSLVVAIKPCEL